VVAGERASQASLSRVGFIWLVKDGHMAMIDLIVRALEGIMNEEAISTCTSRVRSKEGFLLSIY
jgi:hypothetical protein